MKKLLFLFFAYCMLFRMEAQVDPKKTKFVEKWEIKPLFKDTSILKSNNGVLDLEFSGNTSWRIKIINPAGGFTELTAADVLATKKYALPEGEYTIELNRVRIEKVPIQHGKKTRIRAGILRIGFTSGSPDGKGIIKKQVNETSSIGISVDGSGDFALPVGSYELRIYGNFPVTPVKINDKVTKEFFIESMQHIVHSYDVTWHLYNMDGSDAFYAGGGTGHVVGAMRLPLGEYLLKWGTKTLQISVNMYGNNTSIID